MGTDSTWIGQNLWTERVFCVLGTRSEGVDVVSALQVLSMEPGQEALDTGSEGGRASQWEEGTLDTSSVATAVTSGPLGRPPETETRDQSWTLKLPSEAGKRTVYLSICLVLCFQALNQLYISTS